MARRNHVRQALDFVSAAKTTLFASEVEKVQDGLFRQPASGADGANGTMAVIAALCSHATASTRPSDAVCGHARDGAANR
jgi:hypothetical protein